MYQHLVYFDSSWRPGEPDNYEGDEDCVGSFHGESSTLWANAPGWHDWPCSNPLRFMCERVLQ